MNPVGQESEVPGTPAGGRFEYDFSRTEPLSRHGIAPDPIEPEVHVVEKVAIGGEGDAVGVGTRLTFKIGAAPALQHPIAGRSRDPRRGVQRKQGHGPIGIVRHGQQVPGRVPGEEARKGASARDVTENFPGAALESGAYDASVLLLVHEPGDRHVRVGERKRGIANRRRG